MIHGGVEFPWWRAEYLEEITPEEPRNGRALLGDPEQDRRDWAKLRCFRDARADAELTFGLTVEEILHRSATARAVERPAKQEPDWVRVAADWVALAQGTELPVESLDLLEMVRPLLTGAFATASQRIAELEKSFDTPLTQAAEHVIHAALQSLPMESVTQAVSRVAVLEMHLARHQGRLEGQTGTDRFQEFIAIMREPAGQGAVWAKYPVMVRFLVTRLTHWVDMVTEFFGRLRDDYRDLCDRGLVPAGVPLHATFATGDAHNDGRSVIVLKAEDGSGVVYKPRPATIDQAFGRVLDHVNAVDPEAQLRLPRLLARERYSWHEFVRAAESSAEASERLAYRLGVLNAVIFMLSGNDFHHENIVLRGAHPVPIDLETACHPETRGAAQRADDYLDFSGRAVRESVAITGILPGKIISQGDEGTIASDISVIGYRPGQRSILRMPTVQGYGTDEMRFEQQHPRDETGQDGYVTHELITNGESFVTGFEATLHALLRHRDHILADDGVLAGFRDAEMRYIARPTMVYGKVLMESLHPDFLTFGPRREIVLAKLCSGFDGQPYMRERRRQEKASLLVGDIPYFSRTGRQVSWLDGDDAPTLFDRLLTNVDERLTAGRIAYEVDVARMSFAASKNPVSPRYELEAGAAQRPTTADDVAQIARRLASDIHRRALTGPRDSDVAFTTVMPVGPEHWIPKGSGMDVYSGLTGIYLALKDVITTDSPDAELVERLRATVLGRRVVATEALAKIDQLGDVLGTGAYSELGGYLLALGQIHRESRPEEQPVIAADIRLALHANHALAVRAKANDVVSGIAGLMLAILSLPPDVAEPERATVLADLAGELIARADRTEHGLAWLDPETGVHLLGYSHGAAGIAVALLAAGHHLDAPEVTDAGLSALRFDDSFMDPTTGDWPDLRETTHDGDRLSMRAWCHGSPGALLARSMAWPYLDPERRDTVRVQVAAALPGILASVETGTIRGGNVSLCHGTLGNLVILDHLRENGLLGEEIRAVIDAGVQEIVDELFRAGWTLGALPGAHVPDLMMGLSGVAWGLARLSGTARSSVNLLALGPEVVEACLVD